MKTIQILTSCDAPDCLVLSTRTLSPGELVDDLPPDWTRLDDGKTICFRHKVQTFTFVDDRRI